MINFDDKGLIPAIIQDATTGQVLMVGYMNQESLERTRQSGQVWFYSRSRQELWHKGNTSASYLNLREIRLDCDGDALLFQVEPEGPVCHTGEQSCFFQKLREGGTGKKKQGTDDEWQTVALPVAGGILGELFAVVEERKQNLPEGSYTATLFRGGVDRIAKKVAEEAGEVIIAAKNGQPLPIAAEMADLWFHTLVLLAACDMGPDDVLAELRKRRG